MILRFLSDPNFFLSHLGDRDNEFRNKHHGFPANSIHFHSLWASVRQCGYKGNASIIRDIQWFLVPVVLVIMFIYFYIEFHMVIYLLECL